MVRNRAVVIQFVLVLGFLFGEAVVDPATAQDSSIEKKSTLGPVTAVITLSPSEPVIGDTLNLEIAVTARQKVEVLMPEFGEALGRFQIIDFLPKETLQLGGETLFLQKYRLQSPPSGQHAIPPILIEFVDRRPGEQQTPNGLDAYELFTERINFSVDSVLVNDASTDLNPPMGRLDPEEQQAESLVSRWAYVGVFAAGLLGVALTLLAGFFYKRRVIRKSAYEIARRQLDNLLSEQNHSANTDFDQQLIHQFYVDLTSIVRSYLENRFDLRAPELTTEEFLLAVSDSAELSSDHKKLLDHFLKHADLVKFAGLAPGILDIEQSIESASRFLEETRENSPLLVDPESQQHPVNDSIGAKRNV